MAFRGLLAFVSLAAVWALTLTLERISPQVLPLLGISGATCVAVLAVGFGKKRPAQLHKG